MVTFFCSNCGNYLKKKQAEVHGYCSSNLDCNDCKKTINGMEAVRLHTTCGAPTSKKIHVNKNIIQKIKVEETKDETIFDPSSIDWNGFRNTLRKIVKKSSGQSLKLKNLRVRLKKVMRHHQQEVGDDFEKKVSEKVLQTKNIKLVNDQVTYSLNK